MDKENKLKKKTSRVNGNTTKQPTKQTNQRQKQTKKKKKTRWKKKNEHTCAIKQLCSEQTTHKKIHSCYPVPNSHLLNRRFFLFFFVHVTFCVWRHFAIYICCLTVKCDMVSLLRCHSFSSHALYLFQTLSMMMSTLKHCHKWTGKFEIIFFFLN